MTARIIGLITARGGSKGIPGKNIKLLAGKPLIAWTIEAALGSRQLDRLIVSTDDAAIAEAARRYGADVPFMRPAELAQDTSSHISVVDHALDWLAAHDGTDPDYVLLLQPTSPLRTAQDIDATIELALQRQAVAVVSVCEVDQHPLLCQRVQPDGTLAPYMTSELTYLRRQDLPPAYALNGALYLNRSESLRRDRTFLPVGTLPYVMPRERSLDIDTPWDWHLVELVLGERHAAY